MHENSFDFNSAGQGFSSSSFPKNNTNEDVKMNETKDESQFIESMYRNISEELIDDAILDVCFEVHKAAKLNFQAKVKEENFRESESFFKVKEQPKTVVQCTVCGVLRGTRSYTTHLSDCMGFTSKRKASQKVMNFQESDCEVDEDCESEDFKPGAPKKRSKKGNKNVRKQPKLQGNVSKQYLKADSNVQNMSHAEKTAFFVENCGAISKKTKKLCTRTLNCSQHTEEERRDVRNDLLRVVSDQIPSDEEIDVDAVYDDPSPQYTLPS